MDTQIQKQIDYTTALDKLSEDVEIVVPKAFVRGMRDLGYKDPGKALAELVDNAKEAGATFVHIIFGYDPKDKNKTRPISVGVFDNGGGMVPRMIPRAMTWGGTSRENSRSGFGRYGFGLPASCVSIGTKFSVFSKAAGHSMQSVTVDLEDIANQSGSYKVERPKNAELPAFVMDYLSENGLPTDSESCTLVLIEECDNFTRSTTNGLSSLLMEHFGVTYHSVRRGFEIVVNGTRVEPFDPLFATASARFYDLDEERAKVFDPIVIPFKDQKTREVVGQIRIRFSLAPTTFHFIDKESGPGKSNYNRRWSVMKTYTGLIVSRNGRVIDVLTSIEKKPGEKVRLNSNNDRFVRIELDFDATLDEYFGVTTSKQQITLDHRIIELLIRDGFFTTLRNLRSANKSAREGHEAKVAEHKTPEKQTATAVANKAATVFKESEIIKDRRQKEGKQNLLREAKVRAKTTNRSVAEEVQLLEAAQSNTKFDTKMESIIGGPFFRVELIGGVLTLFLNQSHRFFSDVFMAPDASQRTRNSIKLLLLAIGWCMEEATDDARLIYKVEIPEWSKRLEVMLDILAEAQDPKDLEPGGDSDETDDKVA